jgi:polysaccharide deacetylase family protein (PEP-CTERM system associated)
MISNGMGSQQRRSTISRTINVINIMTVDVEDWLESSLELFDEDNPVRKFNVFPTERVVVNTKRLLDIFSEAGVIGTFFVLGTVAENYPQLVKEIHQRGHEISSHGYRHELVYKMQIGQFRESLQESTAILGSLTGKKVEGYRAPYASITQRSEWALDVVQEMGFDYDSSIFPIRRRLYGSHIAKTIPHVIREGINPLMEFPFSTIRVFGQNLPVGGGYFRLFPYGFTRWALRRINQQGQPAVFYLHPYEMDAEELLNPLPVDTWKARFIRLSQGLNRGKTEAKLRKLLADFKWTSVREWRAGHK